jgi:hypothetical protein
MGDLAVRIEHEFFGDDAFTEVVKGQRRIADRFAVAEGAQRLSEQLMPVFDRANRMMIRNLKAIKELRQGQVPAIAIGRRHRHQSATPSAPSLEGRTASAGCHDRRDHVGL